MADKGEEQALLSMSVIRQLGMRPVDSRGIYEESLTLFLRLRVEIVLRATVVCLSRGELVLSRG